MTEYQNTSPRPRAYAISTQLHDTAWKQELPNYRAVIGKAVRATLHAEGVREASLSVALMEDEAVRELNAQFRGKDTPTNVLSFPDGEEGNLGDIALAFGVVKREAMEQKKPFSNHLSHMVVHATLHLLGYDHIEEDEAEAMETKEIAILSRIGIENPYVTR